MSIGGMGGLEIFVIMLVAFIVLGPQRMVEAARFLGKAVREVRRMTAGMQEIVMDDYGDVTPSTGETRVGPESKHDAVEEHPADDQSNSDDGPVAHRPSPGTVVSPKPYRPSPGTAVSPEPDGEVGPEVESGREKP